MTQDRIAAHVLAFSLLLPAAASAHDWPNWRGPSFNGSSEQKGLPVQFSPVQNVRWAAKMPGPSAATPIVWGDHVFVSSCNLQEATLLALCLDRRTGVVKWTRKAGSGYRPAGMGNAIQLDYRSNYASPSPVTDGKRVVFFYGNGDLLAYDFEGRQLWARNLQRDYGDFCFGWTFSSSPLLHEGRLYMQILQRDRPVSGRGRDGSASFLLALDPATGRELWKSVRPSPARMESREAFTTPIPYTHNGRKELLLVGGDVISGHDPATGRELWRWGTWNAGHNNPAYRLVPSPVAGAGVVLACGPKREPVFAIKLGGSGDLGPAGVAWSSGDRSVITTDVPTPLFYRNRFFILSDLRKAITCVEPGDGRVVWTTELPGPAMCWGSPTGADGKLYLISLRGEVHVLDAASGRILATNPMAEGENEIRSTVVAAHGNLFVRTNSRLYCIGR